MIEGQLRHVIIERRRFLGQPFDGFRTPCYRFGSKLLVALRQSLPVISVLLNELFQFIAQALIESRVLVEVHCAMLTKGVLHLTSLGLRIATGVFPYVGHKISREQFNRRNLWVNAEVNEVLVDESLHLCPSIREIRGESHIKDVPAARVKELFPAGPGLDTNVPIRAAE